MHRLADLKHRYGLHFNHAVNRKTVPSQVQISDNIKETTRLSAENLKEMYKDICETIAKLAQQGDSRVIRNNNTIEVKQPVLIRRKITKVESDLTKARFEESGNRLLYKGVDPICYSLIDVGTKIVEGSCALKGAKDKTPGQAGSSINFVNTLRPIMHVPLLGDINVNSVHIGTAGKNKNGLYRDTTSLLQYTVWGEKSQGTHYAIRIDANGKISEQDEKLSNLPFSAETIRERINKLYILGSDGLNDEETKEAVSLLKQFHI